MHFLKNGALPKIILNIIFWHHYYSSLVDKKRKRRWRFLLHNFLGINKKDEEEN